MRRLAFAFATVTGLGCGRHPEPAGAGPSPLQNAVLRADQAPILGLADVLSTDSLVGHRVRVLGWCAATPGVLAGERSGAWVLATGDTSIEVRGLVPPACERRVRRQALVLVFAQVVPAAPQSGERLLLRLPE